VWGRFGIHSVQDRLLMDVACSVTSENAVGLSVIFRRLVEGCVEWMADVLFQASATRVYGEQIGTKIGSVRVRRCFRVCYHRYLCVIVIRQACGDGQTAGARTRTHTHTHTHTLTHTHTECSVNKTKTKHICTSALPSTYHVV